MWKAEEKERIPSKKKSEKEGQEKERSGIPQALWSEDSSIDLVIDCENLLLTVTP